MRRTDVVRALLVSFVLVPLAFVGGRQVAKALPRADTRLDVEPADPGYDLTRTGIDWKKGIDAAIGHDRPILLFQLLGDFDDAMC